ncbi:MAG: DUF2974 domain-containing protein [Ruminococcus sp.]|nr:DUF2974 domain-containing protein [Ruminococcus sp.]
MPENYSPGIIDYIKWRGDISLDTDPFGTVDALVLAELSYVSFEKVLCTDAERLSLRTAAARFSKDDVDEKLRIYTFEQDAELLALAGGSERFGNIVAGGYTAKLSAEREQQFAAMTFTLPDGTVFIAYRGTDDTIAGWKEDFNFSYMTETPAQKLAAEYLEARAAEFPDARLLAGGHSKGGNLAVYAAMKCSGEVRGRLMRVYSLDSPGFRDETVKSAEFRAVQPIVTSVIPESSLVGQLLTGETEHGLYADQMIVRSSGTGVMQHMAFTWEVMRNRFVRAEELSGFGTFVNRTVRTWLSDMDDENRRMFTKALFDVLEASDADTFSELGKSKLKTSAAFIKAMKALKPEQQAAMKHAFKELAKSGRHALIEFAEEWKQSEQAIEDKSQAK